ncbi:MAG: 23S rRNA (guanosine(2251)-2'-O)-methyltransferase RlmB [Planctomycetota bacterium]|nr:23S rRNA (guanosine(2251)-2'-O)-methyltransferase RlmB [Planctomycetota bacterium]
MPLCLRNPHSVAAVLETRPADVIEIRISGQAGNDAWSAVIETAKRQRVPVIGRGQIPVNRRGGDQGRRSATVEAIVKPRSDAALESLFADEDARGVWLALDHIQDVHNMGAVIRSAAFWGVKGIVLTKDQSAPLNDAVYDVASGGMEYVPICVVNNLVRGINAAKKSDVWVLGTSEHADHDISQVDRNRRWLVIVGNEEKGIRRLTRENCDELCRLTSRGKVTSLNVSVAAGSLLAILNQ